ncbi:hypothetical protein [Pseudotamlana agarivorans]|uniref:hypothetical protein n=1 Tax=Pseudotamlana agarivorans TaxID=481183 RepID=UPI00082D683E|nr:hypothetical protein [Tamlana agarivorans]
MKSFKVYSFLLCFLLFLNSKAQVSLEYTVHIQSDGDKQGWVSSGMLAGKSKKVKKAIGNVSEGEGVVQEFWVEDGDTKRIEGIKIRLKNAPKGAYIEYRAHSESKGWMPWVRDGQLAGTEGEGKRMEAIQIRLGNLPNYKVIYKVKFECTKAKCIAEQPFNDGESPTEWSNWMNEGDVAGTVGERRRLSHIIIKLVSK